MQIAFQVFVSFLLVVGVLWFMWRLPREGEKLYGWAPPLAFISPWAGLISLTVTILLWFLQAPDGWLPAIFLVLDPAAIGCGVLVLWIYRGAEASETVGAQRIQAKVGIVLGLLCVAVGYYYVMTHKTPFTPVGQ